MIETSGSSLLTREIIQLTPPYQYVIADVRKTTLGLGVSLSLLTIFSSESPNLKYFLLIFLYTDGFLISILPVFSRPKDFLPLEASCIQSKRRISLPFVLILFSRYRSPAGFDQRSKNAKSSTGGFIPSILFPFIEKSSLNVISVEIFTKSFQTEIFEFIIFSHYKIIYKRYYVLVVLKSTRI